jgi:hypothetical protein
MRSSIFHPPCFVRGTTSRKGTILYLPQRVKLAITTTALYNRVKLRHALTCAHQTPLLAQTFNPSSPHPSRYISHETPTNRNLTRDPPSTESSPNNQPGYRHPSSLYRDLCNATNHTLHPLRFSLPSKPLLSGVEVTILQTVGLP